MTSFVLREFFAGNLMLHFAASSFVQPLAERAYLVGGDRLAI